MAAFALTVLPVGAIAFYLWHGAPDLPGEPLAGRVADTHGNQSIAEMFARVERHLEEHPDDGRGWEVVAPVYMRLGRYDDAVTARRNALRLLGETAERDSGLGEALVGVANGVVTEEAKGVFDRALRADPKDVAARFYSGVAAEQDGRKDDAAGIWRALIADAPDGAPWLGPVQRALARVEGKAVAETEPGQEQGEGAAAAPPPAIRAMVERLAERLKQDGSDVDGWIRLVRSYTVLKDADRAAAATQDARRALAGDADKSARLEQGLHEIAAGTPPSAAPATSPSGAGPTVAAAPPAGDSADQAQGAAQDAMIRGMVERLAERLKQDGSDVDGWIRLVRSYVVLGQADKARAAADDARRALKDDPDKLRRLDEGARSVGLGG